MLLSHPAILDAAGNVVEQEKLPSMLASAYGIAVTGAMFVDTLLFFVILRYFWRRPLWQALLAVCGFGVIDVVFISSNLLKIPDGAWLPLALGGIWWCSCGPGRGARGFWLKRPAATRSR